MLPSALLPCSLAHDCPDPRRGAAGGALVAMLGSSLESVADSSFDSCQCAPEDSSNCPMIHLMADPPSPSARQIVTDAASAPRLTPRSPPLPVRSLALLLAPLPPQHPPSPRAAARWKAAARSRSQACCRTFTESRYSTSPTAASAAPPQPPEVRAVAAAAAAAGQTRCSVLLPHSAAMSPLCCCWRRALRLDGVLATLGCRCGVARLVLAQSFSPKRISLGSLVVGGAQGPSTPGRQA